MSLTIFALALLSGALNSTWNFFIKKNASDYSVMITGVVVANLTVLPITILDKARCISRIEVIPIRVRCTIGVAVVITDIHVSINDALIEIDIEPNSAIYLKKQDFIVCIKSKIKNEITVENQNLISKIIETKTSQKISQDDEIHSSQKRRPGRPRVVKVPKEKRSVGRPRKNIN